MQRVKTSMILISSVFILPAVVSQGLFLKWNVSSAEGWITGPRVIDLNLDQIDEIIAIESGEPPVLKCIGADGRLSWQAVLDGSAGVGVAVGDLDGDSKLEVVAASSHPLGSALFAFKANGKPMWKLDLEGLCTSAPLVVDLDWDGFDEVLVVDEGRGLHAVDGRTGSIIWTAEKRLPGWNFISVADVQRNGKLEVIWLQNKTGSIWFIDANGKETRKLNRTGDRSYFGWPMIGDIDADGYLELVVCTAEGVVCIDPLRLSTRWTADVPSRYAGALADVDMDGCLETLVPGNGKVTVLDVRGNTKYESIVGTEGWVGSVVVGDVDGDGIQEAVFSPHGTQILYVMDARSGNLESSFSSFLGGISEGRNPPAIADGDWDGAVEVYFGMVGAASAPLYALTSQERGASRLDWPQLFHDSRGTSNYETPMRSIPDPTQISAGCLAIILLLDRYRPQQLRHRTGASFLRANQLGPSSGEQI